jgi:hypothetical protein
LFFLLPVRFGTRRAFSISHYPDPTSETLEQSHDDARRPRMALTITFPFAAVRPTYWTILLRALSAAG